MDPLLATALEAAEAAAAVHISHFGKVGLDGAEAKAHSDFVSRVDLEAQERALDVIHRRFPHHAVLAEEDDGRLEAMEPGRAWPREGGYVWIVDPLDGTTNFLHRHPQFAASVGVARALPAPGGPEPGGWNPEAPPPLVPIFEAGAVVAGRTGERWWARRGQGAFKNGIPITVSPQQRLGLALVGTGFPFKEPDLLPRYLEEFRRVLPASGGIRRTGSAALDLCYLAEGILDGFWEEAYLSPWDVAAGIAILREAGGIATRLDGSEIDLENGSVLAANNRVLLRELARKVTGEAPRS